MPLAFDNPALETRSFSFCIVCCAYKKKKYLLPEESSGMCCLPPAFTISFHISAKAWPWILAGCRAASIATAHSFQLPTSSEDFQARKAFSYSLCTCSVICSAPEHYSLCPKWEPNIFFFKEFSVWLLQWSRRCHALQEVNVEWWSHLGMIEAVVWTPNLWKQNISVSVKPRKGRKAISFLEIHPRTCIWNRGAVLSDSCSRFCGILCIFSKAQNCCKQKRGSHPHSRA